MFFRQITKLPIPLMTANQQPKGNFWGWVNMIFNRVDRSRLKKVGPERLCTEWLLKNGACVRFTTPDPTRLHCDYNSLPSDTGLFPYKIKEVIANNSGIMDIGFQHFVDCTNIDTVKLEKCVYIDDASLRRLEILKGTLRNLEIIDCKNVTAAGLVSLKALNNLEKLVVENLPHVQDLVKVEAELNQALPQCKIYLK